SSRSAGARPSRRCGAPPMAARERPGDANASLMLGTLSSIAPWAALTVLLLALLALDLKLFARERAPSFREGVAWSIGWLALSLLAAAVVWLLSGPRDAGLYTTVYLVERALSLDNLFVFL